MLVAAMRIGGYGFWRGFGTNATFSYAKYFPRYEKRFLGPGPFDDLQRLSEALATFFIGNAVGLVSVGKPAASDAEDKTSVADLVDGGSFFGQPQRMAERQHLDRGANLYPTRTLGNGGSKDQWRCQDRTIGREMQLRKPHGVEPPLLGGVYQREGLREGFCFARILGFLKLVEQTKFHRSSGHLF